MCCGLHIEDMGQSGLVDCLTVWPVTWHMVAKPLLGAANSIGFSNSPAFAKRLSGIRKTGFICTIMPGSRTPAIRRNRIGSDSTSPCPPTMAAMRISLTTQVLRRAPTVWRVLHRSFQYPASIGQASITRQQYKGGPVSHFTPLVIQGTNFGLTIDVDNSQNGIISHVFVFKKVGTVAGHDDLSVLAGGTQCVSQNPGSTGMHSRLRLLNTQQGDTVTISIR